MTKYIGPCLQCNKMNAIWYARKLCPSCYRKLRESDDFVPRSKHTGPCVICGTYKSSNKRFVNKMCHACKSRMATSGNREPRRRYEGPCTKCGATNPGFANGYFVKKMCRKCYKKSKYKKVSPKQCVDCGKDIGIKSYNKRCRNCHHKYRWRTDPKYRAQYLKRIKRYRESKKGREINRMNLRKRRMKRLNVENALTQEQWNAVLQQFNYRCAYCGSRENLEMDHIIPISKDGEHNIHNVVPACRSCNASKYTKPPPSTVQPVLL